MPERRARAEADELLHVVGHDLMRPLATVLENAGVLENSVAALDTDSRRALEMLLVEAHRLESMLNDLRTYARDGTDSDSRGPVDCGRVLDGAIAMARRAITGTGAVVSAVQLPVVYGSRSQMLHVFHQLIDNAIKFRSERPPRIHVEALRQGEHWVFRFTDNGIGIEPRHHEAVFGLFQRLHEGDDYPGSGLGLALVRRIVERHGGHAWVESDLGRGARFCFTLPAYERRGSRNVTEVGAR
jgi:light-regulated signal transduction histidine kinase (bacteriophytochrome)